MLTPCWNVASLDNCSQTGDRLLYLARLLKMKSWWQLRNRLGPPVDVHRDMFVTTKVMPIAVPPGTWFTVRLVAPWGPQPYPEELHPHHLPKQLHHLHQMVLRILDEEVVLLRGVDGTNPPPDACSGTCSGGAGLGGGPLDCILLLTASMFGTCCCAIRGVLVLRRLEQE